MFLTNYSSHPVINVFCTQKTFVCKTLSTSALLTSIHLSLKNNIPELTTKTKTLGENGERYNQQFQLPRFEGKYSFEFRVQERGNKG